MNNHELQREKKYIKIKRDIWDFKKKRRRGRDERIIGRKKRSDEKRGRK